MISLRFVKLTHTLVWLVMVSAIMYILYSGFVGTSGFLLWCSFSLLFFECLVLLFNGFVCPLTPLAYKYTSDRSDNVDIYLPLWLARYNKVIFGFLFVLGLLLWLYRLLF